MMKRMLAGAMAFILVIALFGFSQPASAAFNRNRIIDDSIFNRTHSMAAWQIDAFLNGFPHSCISPNSGFQARVPSGYSPSGSFTYGDFVSAGQVIATAAQVYGLNPQVLLVTLEKEQNLVTGRSSSTYCGGSEHKYASAMGFGCLDSGSTHTWTGVSLYRRHGVERTDTGPTCVNRANKAGFSQQITRATWLLKFSQQRSMGNTGWAVITGSWDNSDDPRSCYAGPMTQGNFRVCPNGPTAFYDGWRTIDGQAVHMDTGATAALYWYTPHFNGNKNFYNLFTSWFGSVYGNPSNIKFKFENLDGGSGALSGAGGQVGNYSHTITVGDTLHVFYYDIAGGNLRHAWVDAQGWHFETVDGVGGGNGLLNANVGGMPRAILYKDQLYVAYHDFTSGDLRLAVKNGGTWSAQTLDGSGGGNGRVDGIVGWDTAMVLRYNGNILDIFYSHPSNGDLRHAWSSNGSTWSFETVDGNPVGLSRYDGNMGQGVSAITISGNVIHATYHDFHTGNLRHAWWSESHGWGFEDLDGAAHALSRFDSNVGYSPTLVSWQNTLQLFYRDGARGVIRHAWWVDGQGWRFEDLDGAPYALSRSVGDLGLHSEIVVQNNTMNVFYYDARTGGIRQAWYDHGGGWHFTAIDGSHDAISGITSPLGEYFSAGLYFTDVQLYYYDANGRNLKHAFGPPL